MREHEDTYVAVVEKYTRTLDGANTFTLMKHKDKVHMHKMTPSRSL